MSQISAIIGTKTKKKSKDINMKSKEEFLQEAFDKVGIKKAWINESKQAVLDAMEEYAQYKLNTKCLIFVNRPTESPQFENDGEADGDLNGDM